MATSGLPRQKAVKHIASPSTPHKISLPCLLPMGNLFVLEALVQVAFRYLLNPSTAETHAKSPITPMDRCSRTLPPMGNPFSSKAFAILSEENLTDFIKSPLTENHLKNSSLMPIQKMADSPQMGNQSFSLVKGANSTEKATTAHRPAKFGYGTLKGKKHLNNRSQTNTGVRLHSTTPTAKIFITLKEDPTDLTFGNGTLPITPQNKSHTLKTTASCNHRFHAMALHSSSAISLIFTPYPPIKRMPNPTNSSFGTPKTSKRKTNKTASFNRQQMQHFHPVG